jgi:hypothetical protein
MRAVDHRAAEPVLNSGDQVRFMSMKDVTGSAQSSEAAGLAQRAL